jgi:hypothetical protein
VTSVANGGGFVPNRAALTTCTAISQFTLTIPAGSPAGRMTITGWVHWTLAHSLAGQGDKAVLYVSASGTTDCGGSDAFRSYAVVPAALGPGTVEGMSPVQITYTTNATQVATTFTFFLNGQNIGPAGDTFIVTGANLEAVYHKSGS